MSADAVEPRADADRLILRPQPWVIAVIILLLGTTALVPAIPGLALLAKGEPAGLLFLALTVFALAAIRLTIVGRIVADQETVTNTRLGERGSCSRRELARLYIGAPVGRSGSPCLFILKDGTVAFRTVAAVWGRTQLVQLANYLGVPLIDYRHPVPLGYRCPVCGFQGLEEPAMSNGRGSGEICPSCGFDFAGPVDDVRLASWRQQWMDAGMPWWASAAGRSAPAGWNPQEQLKNLSS